MPFVELEIPYLYDVTYVPPGKRKPIDGILGGRMTVTVEAVTAAEAPLVISWADNSGPQKRAADIHAYGDGFYSKVVSRETVTLQTVQPEHVHPYDRRDLERYEDGQIPEQPDGRLDSIRGHYNLDRGMEAVEELKEEIRQSAARLLFIDGELHSRCELPKVVATIEYRFHGNDIISIHLGETDENTGAHGMQFSIGDFQSAMAWAEERKGMERQAEVRPCLAVEVHAPDLIPRDTVLHEEALRICRFLMTRDFSLTEQSDEVIDEWKSCRRAMKAATAEPSDENISSLLDAWERFYEVYGSEEDMRRRSYGSLYGKEDDIWYKALTGLRSQWTVRPIMEQDVEAALPRP